ncbi:MAG: hypothetical protein WCO25_01760 [Candidatus Uhrbacteria bacterium]
MKNEKLIVAILVVLLVALSVAAALASRVAPKGVVQYAPYPGKSFPVQAVPITEPASAPLAQ